MRSQRPLVSIIIPSYNCARFINDTLESVYKQTYTNWEIVLIDDGSTDDTRSALAPHKDKIRCFYQETRGPAAARNAGVKRARGKLLAFLDSDDLWLPKKLDLQVRAMETHPDIGLVFTDGKLFDGSRILRDSLVYKRLQKWIDQQGPKDSTAIKGWIGRVLFFDNVISTSTSVLVRKECFESFGGFDEGIFNAEDYDLWLRIAQLYPVVCLRPCLYMWRYRENSASGPMEKRAYHWNKASLPVLEKNWPTAPKEIRGAVRKRLSRKYWRSGWVDFRENRFHDSRNMFLGCLRHNKKFLPSIVFLLASYLGTWLHEAQTVHTTKING